MYYKTHGYLLNFLTFGSVIKISLNAENGVYSFEIFTFPPPAHCQPGWQQHSSSTRYPIAFF